MHRQLGDAVGGQQGQGQETELVPLEPAELVDKNKTASAEGGEDVGFGFGREVAHDRPSQQQRSWEG